jgi:glucokinase
MAAISGSDQVALAVDIGGTKFAAAIVTAAGDVVVRQQVPTPRSLDADVLFEALGGVIDATLLAAGRTLADPALIGAIGVGTAAPLDLRAGTLSPVNIPGWRSFPLRDRLVARYGVPVGMIGDAVAVAVGEHWKGAAQGHDNVLGMVVSTGVGGGLILGGRVLPGATGNAGHIGHASVDPAGPICVCGGIGCLEAIASGLSLAAWARGQGFSGGDGSAVAVAAAAAQGEQIALAAFRRAGDALGMAIAGAVTLLDLDLVVIGGGVAAAGALLFDPLAASYSRYAALGFASAQRVVPATLGAAAGLIGAAAVVLAPERYWPDGDGPR